MEMEKMEKMEKYQKRVNDYTSSLDVSRNEHFQAQPGEPKKLRRIV